MRSSFEVLRINPQVLALDGRGGPRRSFSGGGVEWVTLLKTWIASRFTPSASLRSTPSPSEGKDLLDDIFSALSVLGFVQSTSARKQGKT